MSSTSATLIAWSYGLAGVLYLAFALRVAAAPKRDLRGIALLAASAFTAAWGLLIMSYALVRVIPLLTLSSLADILSYGGWLFSFLQFKPALRKPLSLSYADFGIWVLGSNFQSRVWG